MSRAHMIGALFFTTAPAFGQVFAYEAASLPEEAGWNIVQIWCDPDLSIVDGWFVLGLELCRGQDPPGGRQATYARPLDEYIGVDPFYAEFRAETDAEQSELAWGGGISFALGSLGEVRYNFSVSKDEAQLNRDNLLPVPIIPIEPGVPHTHRLELFADQLYVWYIDGLIVDSGVPEGVYPSFSPQVLFRGKSVFLSNTTRWDYIRYGRIPDDASGDFDSDGFVDEGDLFFFAECLENSGEGIDAGPGCRFADFDFDTDVDCDDWVVFESLCGCSFGSNGDVDENGAVDFDDILCVLNGFAGNFDVCPFDAVDIFPCNGNAVIDFDDILAALEAFAGNPPCPNPCDP